MKLSKLTRLLQSVTLVGICLSPCISAYAAEQANLWGAANTYSGVLNKFSGDESVPSFAPKKMKTPTFAGKKHSAHNLQYNVGTLDENKTSNVRYDQYYNGLPVWHSQVVYHITSDQSAKSEKTAVTGSLVNGIEQDVTDLKGKLSVDEVKRIALAKKGVDAPVVVEKVIYFDEASSKAMLAYQASYALNEDGHHSLPSFIIDANEGKVLEEWDALPHAGYGEGPGGVSVNRLSYRPGAYKFGQRNGTDSFGKLNVKKVDNTICTISNPSFKVYNLKNRTEQQLGFGLPVSTQSEQVNQLVPFAYYCTDANGKPIPNANDNGYAPVNDGLSPVNDVTFFIRQTFNMLKSQYGVAAPIGNQLPLPIYTHIAKYDNASACGPKCMKMSGVVGPQQLMFGNGDTLFSPLTEGDVMSHEFGHLITEEYSNLTYVNQSGGINEAFSDMTGMAMNSYIRNKLGYTWYWDGKDWTTGTSISKAGKPMRYFNEPTLDHVSISHASNYRPGMNTHYSSGVYNKAFYLLSTTNGWSIEKAYQVMLDANMNYWTANTDFNTGACGVRAAAAARGYSTQDVENAFKQVGVVCPNKALV